MVISIALLWTQDLLTFSLGMMFHVFGITSMEVILSLHVMQRIPRSQLSEFEPLRMVSTVMALSIGPWLGVICSQGTLIGSLLWSLRQVS